MARVKFVCPKCGSLNVGFEATSEWDEGAQVWGLGCQYDDGWCNDCGDVEPQEVELTPEEEAMFPARLSDAEKAAKYDALITAIRAMAGVAEICQIDTDWVKTGSIVIPARPLYDAVETFAYPELSKETS